MKPFSLAIVGATGLVGETVLQVLEEKELPIENLYLLASDKSAGEILTYKNKPIMVQDVAEFDFAKANYAIFSAGSEVSKQYAPIAGKKNCVVIDNSSQFRMEDDIPLVVPEVNSSVLKQPLSHNIIANPNCATIQMVVALKPIMDKVGIQQIDVVTFQSVSGQGRDALYELVRQSGEMLNGRPSKSNHFPKQIAFNVLPHIDVFDEENRFTNEENKIILETKKILGNKNIKVNATAVRVPVFYGHSMAVHIHTNQDISVEEAHKLLKKAPGIKVMDKLQPGGYPTAVTEGTGQDNVYVGRVRKNLNAQYGLNMWIVADNLRKGAATNAVQILELIA